MPERHSLLFRRSFSIQYGPVGRIVSMPERHSLLFRPTTIGTRTSCTFRFNARAAFTALSKRRGVEESGRPRPSGRLPFLLSPLGAAPAARGRDRHSPPSALCEDLFNNFSTTEFQRRDRHALPSDVWTSRMPWLRSAWFNAVTGMHCRPSFCRERARSRTRWFNAVTGMQRLPTGNGRRDAGAPRESAACCTVAKVPVAMMVAREALVVHLGRDDHPGRGGFPRMRTWVWPMPRMVSMPVPA